MRIVKDRYHSAMSSLTFSLSIILARSSVAPVPILLVPRLAWCVRDVVRLHQRRRRVLSTFLFANQLSRTRD